MVWKSLLALIASLIWMSPVSAWVPAMTTRAVSRSLKIVALSSSSSEDDEIISLAKEPTPSTTTTSSPLEESTPTSQPKQQEQQLQRQEQQQLSGTELMLAMGTSPRRIMLSVLSASGIALAGNLFGVTSTILTTVPEETVESSGLDTYFPRGDFKRCSGRGYTFVIPKEWVADIYVELAKAQRQTKTLDYAMNQSTNQRLGTLPDAAYGPAGRLNSKGVSESGDINVSVIVSSGLSNFSLQGTLGTPQSAAETLLTKSIAPEGSGRKATLVQAAEDISRRVYQFEYVVDRGENRGPPLRNISVIAASPAGDKLYTLTVVAPAREWEKGDFATKLRKIATSFHMT